jgi:hypothetical protein
MATFDGVDYLFGCDPELFVFDLEQSRYVGAYGIVPGTKEQPHMLDGGMVQVDGLALEFGIAPAEDEEEFIRNIKHVMDQIHTMIGPRYSLHAVPLVIFDEDIIKNSPSENLELGCEPDFCGYLREANPAPTLSDPCMRSGGGHIHIGWGSNVDGDKQTHFDHCCLLARQMDATLGLGSLYWDRDSRRRAIYGRPGAFRPKSYGMEYRTASNAWMQREETQRMAFKLSLMAIEQLHRDNYIGETTVNGMEPAEIIHHNYSSKATAMIDRLMPVVRSGFLAF